MDADACNQVGPVLALPLPPFHTNLKLIVPLWSMQWTEQVWSLASVPGRVALPYSFQGNKPMHTDLAFETQASTMDNHDNDIKIL